VKRVCLAMVLVVILAVPTMARTKLTTCKFGTLTVNLNGSEYSNGGGVSLIRVSTAADTISPHYLGFTPIQVSDMPNGPAEMKNRKFDALYMSLYIPNFTEVDSAITGEGTTDSVIIRYHFYTTGYDKVVHTDTSLLPCSLLYVWDENAWNDPTAWIGGDSTAAYIKPNLTGNFLNMFMDGFYIDGVLTDAAGDTGHLRTTIHWIVKLFEYGD
jgi:hypothetical protein